MTNNTLIGAVLILISLFISAVSQIFLKLSAQKTYGSAWKEYINPLVVIAYGMYVVTTILSVLALRFIPLTLKTALDTAGQIIVPVMCYLILHEKISKRKSLGMCVIVIGIIIFAM